MVRRAFERRSGLRFVARTLTVQTRPGAGFPLREYKVLLSGSVCDVSS
jgi:hypothetical protein